jgi:hypothetical protein
MNHSPNLKSFLIHFSYISTLFPPNPNILTFIKKDYLKMMLIPKAMIYLLFFLIQLIPDLLIFLSFFPMEEINNGFFLNQHYLQSNTIILICLSFLTEKYSILIAQYLLLLLIIWNGDIIILNFVYSLLKLNLLISKSIRQ